MCDFKPGDEVVCVRTCANPPVLTVKDQIYVVERAFVCERGVPRLFLAGLDNGDKYGPKEWWGFNPDRFRKVQRRKTDLSIEAFLTIKPGQFEEPKRAPAKRRERAQ